MCVSAPTLPAALKTLDLVVGAAGAGATATALYLLTYPQKVTVSSLLQGSAASRSVSLFSSPTWQSTSPNQSTRVYRQSFTIRMPNRPSNVFGAEQRRKD